MKTVETGAVIAADRVPRAAMAAKVVLAARVDLVPLAANAVDPAQRAVVDRVPKVDVAASLPARAAISIVVNLAVRRLRHCRM